MSMIPPTNQTVKSRADYILSAEDYLEYAEDGEYTEAARMRFAVMSQTYATLALSAPTVSPSPDPTSDELAKALGEQISQVAELTREKQSLLSLLRRAWGSAVIGDSEISRAIKAVLIENKLL